MAQVSVVRASSVHPLTEVSQKLLHGSRPNFMESYLSTMYTDSYFLYSNFSLFKFVRFFFGIWNPMGAKISKRYSYNFHPIGAKLYGK